MKSETTIKSLLADEDEEFDELLKQTPDEWRKEISHEVEFDIFALHLACADQGQKFTNYAGLSSNASSLRDLKEAEWEEKKGEIDLQVRKDPESYNIVPDDKGKIMEGAVRAAVNEHSDVKYLRREFIRAKEYAKVFNSSGVEGFEHRRAMIRLAGELYLKEYYTHYDVNIKDASTDDFRKNMGDRRRRRQKQTF